MRPSLAAAGAAAAAGWRLAAAQQDWGTQGAWQLLTPSNPGPTLAYRGATYVAGTVVVTANNSGTGQTCALAFDPVANSWAQWPDLVGPAPIADPFAFAVGGTVVVIDETNVTNVATINSAAARSTVGYTWSWPLVTGGYPAPRYGMRFLPWGATVYAFGGMEIAGGAMHNDLWAIDSARLAAAPTGGTGGDLPLMWAQVQGDGTPGFPPGRVGYSLSATTGTMAVLFGGVSLAPNAPPGSLADICFTPATAAQFCVFHRSVWGFFPGDRQAGAGAQTGAAWVHLAEAGAYGGPTPAGRFDHTAGVIGDQLFVFGGTTAAGPTAEMWVYNLVSQAWGQVAPSAPAPVAPLTDLGYGVGVVMGHHMYRLAQAVDPASGVPLPNTAQVWRWAPTASSGGGAPPPADPPMHPGTVAGLTLGVLLSLVNTALLVALGRNAGALPEALCGMGGWWRSRAARREPGFYAATSSSLDVDGAVPLAGAGELYAPPPAA